MTEHEREQPRLPLPAAARRAAPGAGRARRSAPTSCSRSTSTTTPIQTRGRRPAETTVVTAFDATDAPSAGAARGVGGDRRGDDRSPGCRFFAGYPMTPFTEVLEHMASKLPEVGGVCMNAESELEAVGMAWGAAATGTPAATGSTGQGLSLMQESLAEMCARPASRSSCSTWRARRATTSRPHAAAGTATTATSCSRRWTSPEAVELTQLAFHLAAALAQPGARCSATTTSRTRRSRWRWRRSTSAPLPAADWALDGSTGGTGRARLVSPLGTDKQRDDRGLRPRGALPRVRATPPTRCSTASSRWSTTGFVDDADVVVVAFGTPGRYVRAAVQAACGPTARGSGGCGRSRCCRSRPRRSCAGGRRRPRRRGLREQPGPDDRRRAPRRARSRAPCTSSAA